MFIDCLSKAILLLVIYNIVAILLFGIPKSLSATHYLFKEKADVLKCLFPATTIMIAILLLPCWIQCSPSIELKLISICASLSLIGVGITYMFKKEYVTDAVHLTTACLCISFILIWIIFVTPYWYVIVISLGLALIFALMTKSLNKSSLYWIEMSVFIANIVVLILYYFNFIKVY